jgi:ABC-type nickel/cobalt efflux system permease component RcnA
MPMCAIRPQLAAIATALFALLVLTGAALAHPMGNFSINHYTKIVPGGREIELDYIIDMAEIPTFQEIQESGLIPSLGDPSLAPYLDRQAARLRGGLTLAAGGQRLRLETVSRQAVFPPGAGGLPTMKMGFVYRARLRHQIGSAPLALHYRDDNFPGRAGWKEIIAAGGSGAALVSSSVPTRDRSLELTNYPTDMLHSPPQTLQADLTFAAAPPGRLTESGLKAGWLAAQRTAPAMTLEANRQGTPRNAFTELIKSKRADGVFVLMAALIAAVLGGFHALEPGHGKTLVAAYLVGSRGTARHAILLGGVVTASHTVSVYILGIITLYASRWIVPERLYPWLGMVSGLLVAGLGFTLLLRRFAFDNASHKHTHSHGGSYQREYAHDHGAHVHAHHHHSGALAHRHRWWGGHVRGDPHGHHDRESSPRSTPAGEISLSSLLALGITGGIVPCPAALVVLLGALAMHRVAFGLFLIVAFSVGLAGVLISFGLAMVYARRFVSRFGTQGPLTERWLPLASSGVITVVGVAITIQSLMSAGIIRADL